MEEKDDRVNEVIDRQIRGLDEGLFARQVGAPRSSLYFLTPRVRFAVSGALFPCAPPWFSASPRSIDASRSSTGKLFQVTPEGKRSP